MRVQIGDSSFIVALENLDDRLTNHILPIEHFVV